MKKHLLSKHIESRKNASVEGQLSGRTLETRMIETSDLDECFFGPTIVTEQIESSDPDEFNLSGPTIVTAVMESSDPDEFVVLSELNNYIGDFDSILLL